MRWWCWLDFEDMRCACVSCQILDDCATRYATLLLLFLGKPKSFDLSLWRVAKINVRRTAPGRELHFNHFSESSHWLISCSHLTSAIGTSIEITLPARSCRPMRGRERHVQAGCSRPTTPHGHRLLLPEAVIGLDSPCWSVLRIKAVTADILRSSDGFCMR